MKWNLSPSERCFASHSLHERRDDGDESLSMRLQILVTVRVLMSANATSSVAVKEGGVI